MIGTCSARNIVYAVMVVLNCYCRGFESLDPSVISSSKLIGRARFSPQVGCLLVSCCSFIGSDECFIVGACRSDRSRVSGARNPCRSPCRYGPLGCTNFN